MTSSQGGGDELWTTLAGAVDDAAGEALRRVARRSVAWWRTTTDAGRTRADAVGELVATLAAYEQAVELGAAPTPERYRSPGPAVRPDVLVDQLAVMAYDLGLALRAAGPRDPAAAPEGPTDVETVARRAVGHLVAMTYEVDPRPARADHLDLASPAAVGPLRDVLDRVPRHREP